MSSNDSQAAAKAVWLSQYSNDNNPPPAPPPLATRTSGNSSLYTTRAGTFTLGAWATSLVVAMAVILGYLLLGRSTSLSADLSWSQRGDCYRIITPASFVKSFPLPYQVNHTAHKVVLNEIGWSEPEKLLSRLDHGRSSVYLRMESVFTTSTLIKHLADTCSATKYERFALGDAINITHQRLRSSVIEIDALAVIYASMKDSYYELGSSSAEAFKKGQLSHRHRSLIKNQPSDLKYFGIDFYKRWGLPFKEKQRKSEEARLGITALTQESQRLEQIGLVFRELKRMVEDLAASVIRWDTESNDNDSRQERLQEWFRQSIYQNPKLRELWTKLLASVKEGEERLPIEITTKWCEEQAPHGGGANGHVEGRPFPSFDRIGAWLTWWRLT